MRMRARRQRLLLVALHDGVGVGGDDAAGVRLGGVGDDQQAGRQAARQPLGEAGLEHHRALRGAAPEQLLEHLDPRHDRDRLEHARRAEARAQRQRHRVGRGIDDRQPHVVDVGADRVAEDDHLQDRQRDDHDQRPAIAEDVVDLLPQQPEQRLHDATGLASRTNRSSIERGRELLLQIRRRAHRADAPGDHDRDAVAVLRLVHVVRRDEHRRAGGAPPRRSFPRTGGA